jgi:hypothetical protein
MARACHLTQVRPSSRDRRSPAFEDEVAVLSLYRSGAMLAVLGEPTGEKRESLSLVLDVGADVPGLRPGQERALCELEHEHHPVVFGLFRRLDGVEAMAGQQHRRRHHQGLCRAFAGNAEDHDRPQSVDRLVVLLVRGSQDARAGVRATIASTLAAGPTRAFGAVRRMVRQSFETGLSDQLTTEKDSIVAASRTDDAQEGIAAFVAKRRPQFRGR